MQDQNYLMCFNFKVNGCHDKCSFNEPASDGAATHVPPAKGSVGAVSRLSLWDTGDVACPWCTPAAWPLGDNDGFPVRRSRTVSARAQELPPHSTQLWITPFTPASRRLGISYSLLLWVQISKVNMSSCYYFTTEVLYGYWKIIRNTRA